jgi:hypothetical protein
MQVLSVLLNLSFRGIVEAAPQQERNVMRISVRSLRAAAGIGLTARQKRTAYRQTAGGHYTAKTFDGHTVHIRHQPTTAEERAFVGARARRTWEPLIDGVGGDLQLSLQNAKAYTDAWLVELRAERVKRATAALFSADRR